MKYRKHLLIIVCAILAAIVLLILIAHTVILNADFGFSREIDDEEKALRLMVTGTAENWLGCQEADDSHHPIIDLYNAYEPLAQGYTVQYDDNWCATFGSAVAIQCGFTDIIPTECGCERQIGLFAEIGRWEENDDYVPLPGDYIFYCTTNRHLGDCTAWSDHVGIVVGTWHGYIKVIEGNNGNKVAYRYIMVNDPSIRGFGLPNYASKINE